MCKGNELCWATSPKQANTSLPTYMFSLLLYVAAVYAYLIRLQEMYIFCCLCATRGRAGGGGLDRTFLVGWTIALQVSGVCMHMSRTYPQSNSLT